MTPSESHSPVRRYTLANGLTVLHQNNPISRAFCVGVWTRTGSRDERNGEEGLCHFLEHMLFKGTERRSTLAISREIEKIGGSLEAFTTKETMCVYAHVLQDHWALALDLIGDMLGGSVFAEDQVRLERGVVCEEIGDVMDAPDDLIHDLLAEVVFPDHPLGRPVLGTAETVSSFAPADLRRFSRKMFRAPNLVVAVYGNVSARALKRSCERSFGFPAGRVPKRNTPIRPSAPHRRSFKRKLHQQHICIGGRTFSYLEDQRHALLVLTTLVGGGMSSRLFQRIREELGLSYSIYTYADHARDTGLMATYMAVKPRNTARAMDAVRVEYERIRSGGLTERELDDVKEHLKGRILLGLETSTARMMRMARNELSYGRQISERELIRRIDAVTIDDVLDVASRTLGFEDLSVVSLGPSTAGLDPKPARRL